MHSKGQGDIKQEQDLGKEALGATGWGQNFRIKVMVPG